MRKTGFLDALGVLAYIAIVATLMQNFSRIYGGDKMPSYIGPISFLLLFSFSALTVGTLVLGKPVMLYLDGKKKEAVSLFIQTALWLGGFTVLALIIAVVVK